VNSLSAALGLLHDAQPGMNARRALAYLYVCENEGLSLHELAVASRLSDQTASRAVAALAAFAPGLLEPRQDPRDKRLVVLHLTDEGRRLRDAIDIEIRAARPIAADRPPARDPPGADPSAPCLRPPGVRRRSAIVQAVETFRSLGEQLNLMDMLCFLAVAEQPGLSLRDLSARFGITKTMASRAVRGFAPPTSYSALPPALGLLDLRTDCWNNRSRLACVNAAGERLAARLDEIISAAATLVPVAASTAAQERETAP
jgi:DNA-binding MarR family transcriptional regulator